MKKAAVLLITLSGLTISGCQQDVKEFTDGNIKVTVETGEHWKHPFDLFWGIKINNDPQVAVWIEDGENNYLSAIYVSHRAATQSWRMSGGNRRKESLPYWSHQRGIQYKDGFYLPTKEQPLPDAVTGATPRENFSLKLKPPAGLTRFVIYAEFNHSTDFNQYYPASATESDFNYSGGKEGSGQPAVVYRAVIDLNTGENVFKAKLIGHSSPSGNDGKLYTDLSTLTSAKDIVKDITVEILPD